MTDGRALYEAYQQANGCSSNWGRLSVGAQALWKDAAATFVKYLEAKRGVR